MARLPSLIITHLDSRGYWCGYYRAAPSLRFETRLGKYPDTFAYTSIAELAVFDTNGQRPAFYWYGDPKKPRWPYGAARKTDLVGLASAISKFCAEGRNQKHRRLRRRGLMAGWTWKRRRALRRREERKQLLRSLFPGL